MKRKLAVTIVLIIMLIFNFCGSVYAQAVASVAGLSPANSFWNSAKNLIMPVLYRAGSKGGWAAGSFTPASIATVVAGVLYQVYTEDEGSFPAVKYWLQQMSVSRSAGSYVLNQEIVEPVAGGGFAQCIAWFEGVYGVGTLEFKWMSTGNAHLDARAAAGFTKQCSSVSPANIATTCNPGGYTITFVGRKEVGVYNSNAGFGDCKFAGEGDLRFLSAVATFPPSDVVFSFASLPIVIPALESKLETALNAGSSTARAAVNEVMAWLNRQLVGGGSDIDKAGSPSKSVRQVLQTAADAAVGSSFKDALAADANDTTQGEDMGEDLISAADKIALAEKEAELNQEETPPEEDPGEPEDPIVMPDIPEPSETENEDVIGDTGNDADIETEQGKLSTILAPLKAIYETLQGTIMTSINNIIPQGSGGVCSLQASVFNGVFNADFCSIDFSALRTLVIACSALLSLLILLS